MSAPQIVLATNNGDVGGGEVMLLNIAQALRGIGLDVVIIGPSEPGGLLFEATARDLPTISLPARSRRSYMAALRIWRLRHPRELLWCNGLVPSLATAGIGPRLVHLHQLPSGLHRGATEAARIGARAVLVPSRAMAAHVRTARVLANWTDEIAPVPGRNVSAHVDLASRGSRRAPLRVGYLGRFTVGKGIDVLAEAMGRVNARCEGGARLVLAGENRFGSSADDELISRSLAVIGSQIEYAGWVERTDLFSRIDVLAVPSVAPESFGLVAAEAMAAGIPVVVTDAGALPEVVGPEHPWIVPRGEAKGLAEALLDVASGIPARREAAIRGARARWEREFSPTAGSRRVADLLVELGRCCGPHPQGGVA